MSRILNTIERNTREAAYPEAVKVALWEQRRQAALNYNKARPARIIGTLIASAIMLGVALAIAYACK